MKILFATDGSPPALAALNSLLQRRGWFSGPFDLTVLNVHNSLPYRRAAAWAGHEAVQKYYEEEGEAALASTVAALTKLSLPYKAEKRVGEPAPTIVATAVEGAFDVVALGAQGHSALAHFMMGSVAAKVVASSPIPVLLLR